MLDDFNLYFELNPICDLLEIQPWHIFLVLSQSVGFLFPDEKQLLGQQCMYVQEC